MQRVVSKLLRPLLTPNTWSSSHRTLLFHSSSSSSSSTFHSVLKFIPRTKLLQSPHPHPGFSQSTTPPLSLFQLNQCRYVSKSKERRQKRLTPAVSKLKKYKIKPYSSFKSRFKILKDGQIRRWHAGKRHNAHSKSKISKRRLRLPALVHPAYAKVMKKLNFYG